MAVYLKVTYPDGHFDESNCVAEFVDETGIYWSIDRKSAESSIFSTKCDNYSSEISLYSDGDKFLPFGVECVIDGNLYLSNYNDIVDQDNRNKKITFTENCKKIYLNEYGGLGGKIKLPTTTELVFENITPPTITGVKSYSIPNLESIFVPKGSESAYISSNTLFSDNASKVKPILEPQTKRINKIQISGETYEIGGSGGGLDDDTDKTISAALNDLDSRKADRMLLKNYQLKGDYVDEKFVKNEINLVKDELSAYKTIEEDDKDSKVISAALNHLNENAGGGGGSSNIVEITQSEYDALDPKDKDTLYVISDAEEVDPSEFATKEELSDKQDKLVSGTNIKTINGESILGDGNIEIEGGGGSTGDNHYRSEIDPNITYDAPVITVSNGKKEIKERELNNYTYSEDLYNLVSKFLTDSFETTEPRKFFALNNSSEIFDTNSSSTICKYDPSTGRYEFNPNVYIGEGFEGQIWYAGDRVIKQSGRYYFENGAYIEAATNWDDGEELRIVGYNEQFFANGWTTMGGFRFVYMQDRYYETITETAMTDTIKVDYRGANYHIVPKELIKTVNGQSLIGTGNLTVSADYPKYSGQTSPSMSDYFVVRGDYLKEINGARSWVYSNSANTNVLIDRYKYSSGSSTPYHTGNTLAIIGKRIEANTETLSSGVELNQIGEYTSFRVNILKPDELNSYKEIYDYSGSILIFSSGGKLYFRTDFEDQYFQLNIIDEETGQEKPLSSKLVSAGSWSYYAYELEEGKIYNFSYSSPYNSYIPFFVNLRIPNVISFDEVSVRITNIDNDASNSLYMLDNNQKLRVLTEKDLGGISGGGSVDAYTKEETDGLLKDKQDKMTGNYLSKVDVGGSSISIETKSFNGEIVQKTDNINFKTINGQAIFGMGDIKIEGGDTSNLVTKEEFNNTVGNIEELLSKI